MGEPGLYLIHYLLPCRDVVLATTGEEALIAFRKAGRLPDGAVVQSVLRLGEASSGAPAPTTPVAPKPRPPGGPPSGGTTSGGVVPKPFKFDFIPARAA